LTSPAPDARHLVVLAAQAAAEKKATEIVALDVGDIISITEAFVVASASNPRQVRSIVDEIELTLKVFEERTPRGVEGLDDATWVLMDYGDFIVHVFLDETRAYYDLDRLWADAPRIEWEQTPSAQVR